MDGAVAEDDAPARPTFLGNCWWWAIRSYLTRGGYILITKSEWGWWPHFMWSPDMTEVHQFEPTEKRRRRRFPPFVYRGYIKKKRMRGDGLTPSIAQLRPVRVVPAEATRDDAAPSKKLALAAEDG